VRLNANTPSLRMIGNIFAFIYFLVTVIGYFSSLGMVQTMQNTAVETSRDGVDTSFYIQFYTVGLFGVALGLLGLFVAWKLFHLILDMYEAMSEMQIKMDMGSD